VCTNSTRHGEIAKTPRPDHWFHWAV